MYIHIEWGARFLGKNKNTLRYDSPSSQLYITTYIHNVIHCIYCTRSAIVEGYYCQGEYIGYC